jgi:hypothetical protein
MDIMFLIEIKEWNDNIEFWIWKTKALTPEINYEQTTTVLPLDIVIIDQQRVGKRSLHLMDTVNAKKR